MPERFPTSPIPASRLIEQIETMQSRDIRWRNGRAFAFVYHADAELESLLHAAYCAAFSTNGLSPSAFPSIAIMEHAVIEMVGDLLGCPEPVGSMTSGGSESIFLAVKSARDRMLNQRPDAGVPHVVLASSAHPAFSKAAHILGLATTRVPVDPQTFRADPVRMVQAIQPTTALMVASAPSYPHGVVDPVAELASYALSHDVLLHVDACIGGMLLPFVRELGEAVPAFDFSVPGVTSMSVDLHKFGYSAKGASLVLYRDPAVFAYQPFVFDDWAGGRYSAPNLAGTRPGGAIAAAWACLNFLAADGYLNLTRRALSATSAIIRGIERLPGLQIMGEPDATLLAFGSPNLPLGGIVSHMRERGWSLGLQGPPESVHLTVTASHDRITGEFLSDLEAACTTGSSSVVRDGLNGYN